MRSLPAWILALSISLVGCGCEDCPTPLAPSPPPATADIKTIALVINGTSDLNVGQSAQLNATARMSDQSERDVTGSAFWRSSNTSVCTVSAAGALTGTGAGACDVAAIYQEAADNHDVTVRAGGGGAPPPTPSATLLSVSVNGPTRLRVGQQVRWGAFARYADGHETDVTASAVWFHDNANVADAQAGGCRHRARRRIVERRRALRRARGRGSRHGRVRCEQRDPRARRPERRARRRDDSARGYSRRRRRLAPRRDVERAVGERKPGHRVGRSRTRLRTRTRLDARWRQLRGARRRPHHRRHADH